MTHKITCKKVKIKKCCRCGIPFIENECSRIFHKNCNVNKFLVDKWN